MKEYDYNDYYCHDGSEFNPVQERQTRRSIVHIARATPRITPWRSVYHHSQDRYFTTPHVNPPVNNPDVDSLGF